MARGDIARGAEVTISYIDCNERANVRERRAELAEYGFMCACAKCAREAGKEAAKGAAKKVVKKVATMPAQAEATEKTKTGPGWERRLRSRASPKDT